MHIAWMVIAKHARQIFMYLHPLQICTANGVPSAYPQYALLKMTKLRTQYTNMLLDSYARPASRCLICLSVNHHIMPSKLTFCIVQMIFLPFAGLGSRHLVRRDAHIYQAIGAF